MSQIAFTPTWLLVAGAVLPLAAVGTAFGDAAYIRHAALPLVRAAAADLVAISLAALLGLAGQLTRLTIVRRVGAALMALLALSGVAAALWQHFVASSSTSCELTLADRIVSGMGADTLWPAVFAPYASCADAADKLLAWACPTSFAAWRCSSCWARWRRCCCVGGACSDSSAAAPRRRRATPSAPK